MKRTQSFFMAVCAAFLLLAGPFARAETPGQPGPAEGREEKTEHLSAEDREIIEHMEMLQNFELYEDENMELLLTLDLLTANE